MFAFGERKLRRRNQERRELNAPPVRGTAKRPLQKHAKPRPIGRVLDAGLLQLKIRGFLQTVTEVTLKCFDISHTVKDRERVPQPSMKGQMEFWERQASCQEQRDRRSGGAFFRSASRKAGLKSTILTSGEGQRSCGVSVEKYFEEIRNPCFHLHSTYTRCKSLIINGAGEGNRTLVSQSVERQRGVAFESKEFRHFLWVKPYQDAVCAGRKVGGRCILPPPIRRGDPQFGGLVGGKCEEMDQTAARNSHFRGGVDREP